MFPDDRLQIEGASWKLEFAARFELGGWFVAQLLILYSLMLGRRPMTLGND